MPDDFAAMAYRRLSEMIAGPDWAEGGRLPPEDALSRSVGVSRPVLRRALAELRAEGRITSRRGSGNFVRPRETEVPPEEGEGTVRNLGELEQCLLFRQVVEAEIAAAAALRATPADLRRLAEANERLSVSSGTGSLFEEDFAFHLELARATGNVFFERALTGIKPQVRLAYEFGRKLRTVALNETSTRVVAEHSKVLRAIRAGDAEAARAAMRDHLGAGIARLFGNEP
ncbi:FadR/GntR family transcriptional regulator [Poseidonocella sp. HB161398]|uniref:FadR/GntR family transcriptional regulator n=1 Tax=Poseidonocella sp. HB161398 TaxID=2320855 RepID=UPI0011094098|nr:FCD domain-containing protein [Poseidonocella sp. HB161398]